MQWQRKQRQDRRAYINKLHRQGKHIPFPERDTPYWRAVLNTEALPQPQEDPTPADDVPTPVDEELAPSDDVPPPADEEPAPGDEESAPADEEVAPPDEEPAPADEEPPPVDEELALSDDVPPLPTRN